LILIVSIVIFLVGNKGMIFLYSVQASANATTSEYSISSQKINGRYVAKGEYNVKVKAGQI